MPPKFVRLSQVLKMLKECAPAAIVDGRQHNVWVRHNGRIYTKLPKGKGVLPKQLEKAAGGVEFKFTYVTKMAEFLGIDPACVSKHFP